MHVTHLPCSYTHIVFTLFLPVSTSPPARAKYTFSMSKLFHILQQPTPSRAHLVPSPIIAPVSFAAIISAIAMCVVATISPALPLILSLLFPPPSLIPLASRLSRTNATYKCPSNSCYCIILSAFGSLVAG